MRPGVKALDVFVEDLLEAHKKAEAARSSLAAFFREDSLAGILLARLCVGRTSDGRRMDMGQIWDRYGTDMGQIWDGHRMDVR